MAKRQPAMSHAEAMQTMAHYQATGLFKARKALDSYKPAQLIRKAAAYRNAELAGINDARDMAAYARGHYATPEHPVQKRRIGGRTVYKAKAPSDLIKLMRGAARKGQRVDISIKSKATGKFRAILQNKPRAGGSKRKYSRGISAKYIIENISGGEVNPLANAYNGITGAAGGTPAQQRRKRRRRGEEIELQHPPKGQQMPPTEGGERIPAGVGGGGGGGDAGGERGGGGATEGGPLGGSSGISYSGGGGGGGAPGGGGDDSESSDPEDIDWYDVDEYELSIYDTGEYGDDDAEYEPGDWSDDDGYDDADSYGDYDE